MLLLVFLKELVVYIRKENTGSKLNSPKKLRAASELFKSVLALLSDERRVDLNVAIKKESANSVNHLLRNFTKEKVDLILLELMSDKSVNTEVKIDAEDKKTIDSVGSVSIKDLLTFSRSITSQTNKETGLDNVDSFREELFKQLANEDRLELVKNCLPVEFSTLKPSALIEIARAVLYRLRDKGVQLIYQVADELEVSISKEIKRYAKDESSTILKSIESFDEKKFEPQEGYETKKVLSSLIYKAQQCRKSLYYVEKDGKEFAVTGALNDIESFAVNYLEKNEDCLLWFRNISKKQINFKYRKSDGKEALYYPDFIGLFKVSGKLCLRVIESKGATDKEAKSKFDEVYFAFMNPASNFSYPIVITEDSNKIRKVHFLTNKESLEEVKRIV